MQVCGGHTAVATEGEKRAVPPNSCFFPPFGLLKLLYLEYQATKRQQTMKEKGIIAFTHNSPSTFSRFFAKLLATNCCA